MSYSGSDASAESDLVAQIHRLLAEVIVPNLAAIQASQTEQRRQSEMLSCMIDELRAEVVIRLTELRAETAVFRNQMEDQMVELREDLLAEVRNGIRKPIVH